MCPLSLLLQGLVLVWSISGLVILTGIAFIYARIAVLKLWRARAAAGLGGASRSPVAVPRSGGT